MKPYDLFPEKKLARASHPKTSHKAAKEILDDLAKLQAWTLAAVIANPGLTTNELADVLGLRDPRKIGRRLPELAKKGQIRRGESRACDVTGRDATTWFPKEST